MALLEIQNAKAIFIGNTIINFSPLNLIQFNGENIEYDGDVLTFTEN
jgi:hypothetical protein